MAQGDLRQYKAPSDLLDVETALGEFGNDYDIEALRAAYLEEINKLLPDGWYLDPVNLIGPDGEDIPDVVEIASRVDYWSMVPRFEK